MKKKYIVPMVRAVRLGGEDAVCQNPELTIGSKFESDPTDPDDPGILVKGEDEALTGGSPTQPNLWDREW